jgi:hypothetical protein
LAKLLAHVQNELLEQIDGGEEARNRDSWISCLVREIGVGLNTDYPYEIAPKIMQDAIRAAVEAERAKRIQLAVLANVVMNMLEQDGPKVVPHLVDSDDNFGQFLRNVTYDVLGDYDPTELEEAMMRPDNFTVGHATKLAAASRAQKNTPAPTGTPRDPNGNKSP